MSNAKTVELRTLEDEELLDVVGGCCRPCEPRHCYSPCGDDRCGFGIGIDVNVFVGVFL